MAQGRPFGHPWPRPTHTLIAPGSSGARAFSPLCPLGRQRALGLPDGPQRLVVLLVVRDAAHRLLADQELDAVVARVAPADLLLIAVRELARQLAVRQGLSADGHHVGDVVADVLVGPEPHGVL